MIRMQWSRSSHTMGDSCCSTTQMHRPTIRIFSSLRESTIYRGNFSNGAVTNVGLVPGLATSGPAIVDFDVEISADGQTMIFAEGQFTPLGILPLTADLIVAHPAAGGGFARSSDSAAIMANINTPALEYAAG